MIDPANADSLRSFASPISDDANFDALLEQIGDARIVLLGEATHGTREFYRHRTTISKRLIVRKGFDAIAVEADWPDALAIDRHVRLRDPSSQSKDEEVAAHDALRAFERFPRWMWRNAETLELICWMRRHNAACGAASRRAGFFGLDLYSLQRSMEAVVRYLERVDPEAARHARSRYACFDHLAGNPQRYGRTSALGLRPDCEQQVMEQLLHMQEREHRALARHDADEAFFAEQNARVARNAEAYYRAMFGSSNASWNLRDTHMADTLCALADHITERKQRPARIVVWAHNSHIGDARHTEMGENGQLNLGQLMRERFGEACYLLGFTTHAGMVCAAAEWGGSVRYKRVRPSLPESIEHWLHACRQDDFFLPVRALRAGVQPGIDGRLERAIGVIYLPQSERHSHYFHADPLRQFDGIIHVDVSHALTPLDPMEPDIRVHELETFPSGL